jgi:DNA-binding response OmpR family regulator
MKIVIVEDNKLLAKQILKVLQKEGYEVEVFNEAESFLANFSTNIDILLLDINLPDMEGIEVLELLRKFQNNVKTIFMTSYTEIDYLKKAYKLGCEDYIKKPFEIEELLLRVKRVEESIKPKIVQKGKYRFDLENFIVYISENQISLTKKEVELLEIFLANEGKVVSFDYLNDKLWNGEALANTIIVSVNRLKRKLKFDNLENIRNVGYKFKLS